MRKIKYSPSEQKLLKLLPTNGTRISTEELVARRYAGEETPFHSRPIVLATLNNLIRKVNSRREEFRIRKSGRDGPHPMTVWREHRVTRGSHPPAKKKPRPGIVGEFVTREGSYKEKALLALHARKGKPMSIGNLIKAVYGSRDETKRKALENGVLIGLKFAIIGRELKYRLERKGRGDEATIALVKL